MLLRCALGRNFRASLGSVLQFCAVRGPMLKKTEKNSEKKSDMVQGNEQHIFERNPSKRLTDNWDTGDDRPTERGPKNERRTTDRIWFHELCWHSQSWNCKAIEMIVAKIHYRGIPNLGDVSASIWKTGTNPFYVIDVSFKNAINITTDYVGPTDPQQLVQVKRDAIGLIFSM